MKMAYFPKWMNHRALAYCIFGICREIFFDIAIQQKLRNMAKRKAFVEISGYKLG